MLRRLRAAPRPCLLVVLTAWTLESTTSAAPSVAPASTPASTSATLAGCPNEDAASTEAARGFALRRSARLPQAAAAFEAAYHCMPTDTRHEERWEHLASHLETLQSFPAAASPDTHNRLCRARTLVEDYQRSITAVSPTPEAANYAAAEHRRLTAELAEQPTDRGGCETPVTVPPTPATATASTSAAPPPDRSTSVLPTPLVSPPDHSPPGRQSPHSRRPLPPTRPLWIAGAVTGTLTIVPVILTGVGLRTGHNAEADAGAAMLAGQLQQIRDRIHPAGVRGNRMAATGAILGAALFITTVALLTVAGRRTSLARSRVYASGAGVLVHF